jgi:peptidyl-dipeptidase A
MKSWSILLILAVMGCTAQKGANDMLDAYQAEYERLWVNWTTAEWEAATTGKEEASRTYAQADYELKAFHSDADRYAEIKAWLAGADQLDPLDRRALEVARLSFEGNQLPEDLLRKMADGSAKIEHTFNTFRAEVDGKRFSNNDLLDLLAAERDSAKRKVCWEALKQVGVPVGPMLIELAGVRNEAARSLGFENFWDMKIRLQEHDPDELMAVFDELEKLTDGPFRTMKAALDEELRRKFGVYRLYPWHYDNPYFQAAPPAEAVDLDEFYRDKKKEEIVGIAVAFFADIGLPIEDIVARSDLYEREGKDPNAFCEDMDRNGDVRTLLNIRPTADWMDTMLHENGHAVYDKYLDRSLPFNLRSSNHAFTTEGVAELMGALAKNPSWIGAYAGADQARVAAMRDAILEQRRREQLIFCRWCLVMLHFEKALYEDPGRDLNTLWWDLKERYQLLDRPPERNAPDWAAKQHFTIAPVYYHNYQLGEMFASQLRACLARLSNHKGPASELSFNGRKDFGEYLRKNVFAPGKTLPWPKFVQQATGEPLTARYFAADVE